MALYTTIDVDRLVGLHAAYILGRMVNALNDSKHAHLTYLHETPRPELADPQKYWFPTWTYDTAREAAMSP